MAATKKAPKKVVVLLGSPRQKGNSAVLADQIAKGAKSKGAVVEMVYLHGMKIGPCSGCNACQKPKAKSCVLKDDMQDLYPKLVEADAWVIASPVYWFSMSAQTKLFMDRCYALPAYGKEPFLGKRVAIAMTYAAEDAFESGCVNALRTFQDAYGYAGATIVGMVYGSAMEAGKIRANKPLLRSALELGKTLVAE
jgi:multimeric flavodoxin WrbA